MLNVMDVTCHKYLVTRASFTELLENMLRIGVRCPICLQISNQIAKIPTIVCLTIIKANARKKVLITSYLTCLDLLAAAMWRNISADNAA